MEFKPFLALPELVDVPVSNVSWKSYKSFTPLYKILLTPYHGMISIEHLVNHY
jgi:hypothetical protein